MTEPLRMRSPFEQALVREIESGLPLVERPYAEVAERLGVSEDHVIRTLAHLLEEGDIKRLGVIVRHRELGYRANAMVVWDVPDDHVDAIGKRFGDAPFVTLCYQRPRRLPDWPYNLFTMIHGRDRAHVLEMVETLRAQAEALDPAHEVLFSGRRFKQRGARYGGVRPARTPGADGRGSGEAAQWSD